MEQGTGTTVENAPLAAPHPRHPCSRRRGLRFITVVGFHPASRSIRVPITSRDPVATVHSAVVLLLLLLVPVAAHATTMITCNQPTAAANALLVCTSPDGDCHLIDDLAAPAGCTLDFQGRKVFFDHAFDVGQAKLQAIAAGFDVTGALRATPGNNVAGGIIELTAATGDIVVRATGKLDVSGNSAGVIRLTATTGSVDLQ